jgi:hypothetical protein
MWTMHDYSLFKPLDEVVLLFPLHIYRPPNLLSDLKLVTSDLSKAAYWLMVACRG